MGAVPPFKVTLPYSILKRMAHSCLCFRPPHPKIHAAPTGAPFPPAPYFVVMRIYEPSERILDRDWKPSPIRRLSAE